MKLLLLIALSGMTFAAAPGYKVIGKIKVGGTGGWDYVYVDSDAQRLYVSHTNQTEVIDLTSGKVVGTIPDTQGVHGIAIAADLGRGFTSNGRGNNVTIFDPKTLQILGKVGTGKDPDAILYEPVTHRVFTFNGDSHDSTVIDAKTGKVIGTVPVGGAPEFSQADGKGKLYFNIENTNELVEMDAAKASITKRIALTGCDEPSGLAMDRQKRRLFSVCGNKIMTIVDPDLGKIIATVPIGVGPDGAAFDDGFAFSSNGRDGTITVVGEASPGKYGALETVKSQVSARTIAADPKTHKLYLPAADIGPAPEPKDGKKGRPPILPGTFNIVVVGR